MSPALRFSELGKRYRRRKWALRGCDLELPQGRIAGLVGANGAGKTTLLHLAIGLLKPTEGAVWAFGEPLGVQHLADVGFVAQQHPLYRGFTVREMLHFGSSMNPRFDSQGALRRIQDLGIPLGHPAGKLSGGQQAQVALTLALAKRPRLLVMDEPVASLDPVARRDFMRSLVAAVADGDLTVLLSSHNVSELERVCDHLVLLRQGQVLVSGDIDGLLAEHRLLVGPRVDSHTVDGVVAAAHGERHSNLLVRRSAGVVAHPQWKSHSVSLSELVLAYLEGEG